jgi:hypothetical protein
MDKASESILSLKPVTFYYKSDKTNTAQFGLIAEEVAEVNPDLIVRDKNGEIYSVRYDAVNAMLLNEFLKEHRTVQDLKSTVAKQEATIAQQQTSFQSKLAEQERQIAALTAGLQKVSARLELTKPVRAPEKLNPFIVSPAVREEIGSAYAETLFQNCAVLVRLYKRARRESDSLCQLARTNATRSDHSAGVRPFRCGN